MANTSAFFRNGPDSSGGEPFTGGLHLDEQISSMFKSISFQNDTDDLKQDLWGMEERRLDQVIRKYEQAVAS